MNDGEFVSFISVEEGDDLIVSFFVMDPDDPAEGRSLILMRNPRLERLLPEPDWGVSVSDEGVLTEGDFNLLERIRLGESTAEVVSQEYTRPLDLRKVEASEIDEARAVLEKMNFDNRFSLELL